jgi:MraZ protein
LFLGTYTSTLDIKNHLETPPVFKEQIAGGLFLTQGFDRNLLAFTPAAFQGLYQKVRSLNMVDPLARLLLRLILGAAYDLKVDGDGRLAVPSELKDFADLQENVLLVGQGEYFEIWSPGLWEIQKTQIKDAGKNSSTFSTLTVSI